MEAWNLIIKSHDHPQHRLRPDIFIKEQCSILIRRQRAFVDKLSAKTKNTLKVSKAESDFKYSTVFNYLSVHPPIHPSIYIYIYLSIYLSIYIYIYIYIYYICILYTYIHTYIRKKDQKNPNCYKKNGKDQKKNVCR